MNASARELALLAHAKSRAPILAKCAEMRVAMGMKAHVGLVPVLVLSMGDRL